MMKQSYPKTRSDFPASQGWIIVQNRHERPISLLLEPWGVGLDLAPGDRCHVLLGTNGDHAPSIEVTGEFFIVHGGNAIYQNGKEVYDFSE